MENQVIETLKSVFIIERLGICHSKRVELLEFFDSRSVPLYTPEVSDCAQGISISVVYSHMLYRFTTELIVLFLLNYVLGQLWVEPSSRTARLGCRGLSVYEDGQCARGLVLCTLCERAPWLLVCAGGSPR